MSNLILFAVVAVLARLADAQISCSAFNKNYKEAQAIVTKRREHEKQLELSGYVLTAKDLGFERSRSGLTCNTTNYWQSREAKIDDYLNTAAKLMAENNPNVFKRFGSNAKCLSKYGVEIKKQPKYRSLNGFGNNLKNPYWGTPYTPYGRQGPKSYDDGVSSVKKSVTGAELPNPRRLVLEVLDKADVAPRTTNNLTVFFILNNLYISHDQAHQTPVEPLDNCKEIRCCSSGNKKVLDPSLSHSACLPIAIGQDDEFYKKAGVGCLNMVRSEPVSAPTTIQSGEILNRVTAFVDLSMIYGSDENENRKIRSFKGGKLFLGKNDILPVNSNGKYTKISDRLTTVPLGAIIPVLLSRNHNNLAKGLAKLNPSWNDEKLFQEARRLNIALYEHLFFHKHFDAIVGEEFNAPYNKTIDPSPTVEFITAAYRFFHAFMIPTFPLVDKDGKTERIPMSDTFGRIDLIENRFDDALRGTFKDRMNFGHFSDELYNKFAKNDKGIGLDVVSIDIQRCRDHGVAGYLDFRESIGLKADFKTFDDLLEILPQNHVDLLKNAYEDVRDIDLYVGGALESFANFPNDIVGETFGNIIVNQFTTLVSGDSYYFTHRNSPYPFTQAQIDAIYAYDFQNLICVNSGLEKITRSWNVLQDDVSNPLVPCSNYQQVNLTKWQGI